MSINSAWSHFASAAIRSLGVLSLAALATLAIPSQAAKAETVSGLLTDQYGIMIPNATVTIFDAAGDVTSTTTDAMGSYSLSAPASSNYALRVNGTRGTSGAFVPYYFTLHKPLDLSSNTVIDFSPSAANLDVSLRDSASNAPVVPLTATLTSDNTTATFTGPNGYTYKYGSATSQSGDFTDSNGNVTIIALANSTYTLSSGGNAINGYSPTSGSSGSIGTTTATKTITVPSNRKTFSGTVRVSKDATAGLPIAGTLVRLVNTNTYLDEWSTTTDSSGNFSLTAAGVNTYRVYLSRTGAQSDPLAPGNLTANFSLDLTSDRLNKIIQFDTTTVGIFVRDSFQRGVPVPVQLSFSGSKTITAPFTGVGNISFQLSSSFSDTGISDLLHERIVPQVASLSITGSVPSPSGIYSQASVTYSSSSPNTNNAGINLTLPFGSTAVATSLTANNPNPTIGWPAYTGATSYNIYRNGTFLGTTAGTSYTDTTVAHSSSGGNNYYYEVTAVLGSGVETKKSSIVRASSQLP